MHIGQVSPLYESVPPRLYGGTERVVSYLTEELVRQGHQVTLFATGDSVTAARLVPGAPSALRLDPSCHEMLPHHVKMLEQVFAEAEPLDLLHFHLDYVHYPLCRRQGRAHLTTLHGRLDMPDLVPLYREFDDIPVVSISDSQRTPLPWLNWQATIPHGLPEDLYSFEDTRGSYLAFLGRVSPEKGLDRAIEIAKRVDMPLRIAAKVDRVDKEYFEQAIKPLLDHPLVEYLGEVDEAGKSQLLGQAYALLFPIDWPEPFGMVMIEAMACGTPVVAWNRGSVPEILEEGVSGFMVEDVAGAVAAVERVGRLRRKGCREAFERRFTVRRMAQDYLAVYERLRNGRNAARARRA
jgi:glycosyltransferase involved in cell wall biosynthesis